MLEAEKMKCINCKGDMQEITTTFNSRWGDYTVTIQGVKAHKCDQCDELVFSTEEARMIQKITAGFADSKVKDKPDLINLQETALTICSWIDYTIFVSICVPLFMVR